MSEENTVTDSTLAWAGRVWGRMLHRECRGVLMFSDGYSPELAESMSRLQWNELGRALQAEVAVNLLSLEHHATKAHRS